MIGSSDEVFRCAGPCNLDLTDDHFDYRKAGNGCMYRNKRCRKCELEIQRQRRAAKGNQFRYNQNLVYRYGISRETWELILKSQDNACAICHDSFDGQQINVDHCHDTGLVRGLLCSRCNRGLGLFQDSSEVLRLAADYLERKKTHANDQ